MQKEQWVLISAHKAEDFLFPTGQIAKVYAILNFRKVGAKSV